MTDLLIACAEQYLATGSAPELAEAVVERYALIATELQLGQGIIEKIRDDLFTLLEGDKRNPEQYLDAVKASGEDNNAKLIAAYFRYKGVKAEYVNPKDATFVTNEP